MDTLRFLADRWDVSAGMALVGVVALLPWWRARTAPLALPAFGFLLRKVFLYVPVCGAVSTVDQVTFWSAGAWVFHLVMMASVVVCVVSARMPRSENEQETFGCFVMAGVAALMFVAYILLPLDGWGIMLLPILGVFSAAKLLLVSAVLPLACWLALTAQMAALVSRRLCPQLINVVFVSTILLAGAAGYLGQGFALLAGGKPNSAVPLIRAAEYRGRMPYQEPEPDTWARRYSPLSGKRLFGAKRSDYPQNFLWLWRAQLPTIARTGVHLVEKDVDADELALSLTHPAPAHPGPLLALAASLLALILASAVAERIGRQERPLPSPALAASHHAAPMHDAQRRQLTAEVRRIIDANNRPPPRAEDCHARLALVPGGLSVLLAAALLPAVLPRWSILPYIEGSADLIVGLAGAYLILGLLIEGILFAPLVFPLAEQQEAIARFLANDRGGRARPSTFTLDGLADLAADPRRAEQLLIGQPVAVLLACLVHGNESLRRQALWLMPLHQPGVNIGRLMSASAVECRDFVARHPACPRPDRLVLANDTEGSVRAAALSQLAPVTPAELEMLGRSRWPDVRVYVAGQPGIARPLLRALCADAADSVSHAAFAHLAADVTATELNSLSVGTGAWVGVASHALTTPARVAALIARHIRLRYVIDQPAQGYEVTVDPDGEETRWIQTQAEIGHHEYSAEDLSLANQVIGRAAERREAVLRHLKETNAGLYARLSAMLM